MRQDEGGRGGGGGERAREISDFCAVGRIKSLLLNSACSQISHTYGSDVVA